MSVQALSAVLEESSARLGARLVLIAIANHASEKGENSFPNLETLGREAGLSVRQVIRGIQILEREGELAVTREHNRPNIYRILLPSLIRGDKLSRHWGDKSGPEMSREPSRTKDLNSRDKLTRQKRIKEWEKQGCQTDSTFCDRKTKFCSRCDIERRRILDGEAA